MRPATAWDALSPASMGIRMLGSLSYLLPEYRHRRVYDQ